VGGGRCGFSEKWGYGIRTPKRDNFGKDCRVDCSGRVSQRSSPENSGHVKIIHRKSSRKSSILKATSPSLFETSSLPINFSTPQHGQHGTHLLRPSHLAYLPRPSKSPCKSSPPMTPQSHAHSSSTWTARLLTLPKRSSSIGTSEPLPYPRTASPLSFAHIPRIGNELGVDPNVILATSHGRRSIDTLQIYEPALANWECQSTSVPIPPCIQGVGARAGLLSY
jgi:hypothetical protein